VRAAPAADFEPDTEALSMAEYYAKPVDYPNPPPQPDGRVEPRPDGIPAHSHEGTDVNIRPLVYLGVGLVVFLVATCVFLVFLFDLFTFMESRGEPPVTGVQGVKAELPAGAPKLQGVPGYNDNVPAKDMEEFRRINERLVNSYSTAKDGVARIPVAKAIDLALERQLFKTTPAGPTTAPAQGGQRPGGTGAGAEESRTGGTQQQQQSSPGGNTGNGNSGNAPAPSNPNSPPGGAEGQQPKPEAE
jgi:hypothetical protein